MDNNGTNYSIRSAGFNGYTEQTDGYRLNDVSISVGGTHVTVSDFYVSPSIGMPFAGRLGLGFIQNYKSITFDLKSMRLTTEPRYTL